MVVEPPQAENEENAPTPTPAPPKAKKFDPSPEKRVLKQISTNGAVNVPARGSSRDVQHALQPKAPVSKPAPETDRRRKEASASLQPDDYPVNSMGDDEVDEFISSVENSMQEDSLGFEQREKTPQPVTESLVESIEPASATKARSKTPATKKAGRKRKSDEVEGSEAPVAARATKKVRRTKAASTQAKNLPKIGPVVGQEFRPDLPANKTDADPAQQNLSRMVMEPRTQLSQRQQAELEQIIEKVRARPGKVKSLYVLKRKKAQTSSADDIRSGRATVKPLAYWTADKCVHNDGATLAPGACIPLDPLKEVKHSKNRAGSEDDDAASLNDYHSDGNEEPWELEAGVFRGQTGVWDQAEQNCVPEETEETDLAFHPSAIQTHEVPGSGFKFAKLISTPFFGSGMLDLPPGTIKRPKNSRTMHMCFFVFKGRVTVRIGKEIDEENGEAFSIGKGGMFQVPRGELIPLPSDFVCLSNIGYRQ